MTHLNKSSRALINTLLPSSREIVYRAPMSLNYKTYLACLGIMVPTSCLCCYRKRIFDSTYAEIQKNRVETNYPTMTSRLCWCLACFCARLDDNVAVYYFDNYHTERAGRAECCSRACTHCSCCPTCCDLCGQSAFIHSDSVCCRTWRVVPHLADARAFADEFNRTRGARLGGILQVGARAVVIVQPVAIEMK